MMGGKVMIQEGGLFQYRKFLVRANPWMLVAQCAIVTMMGDKRKA